MQKKRGISLIVLVITIIVMVVLAGAIILTLNNSGIINKASGAVEETNLATAKEVATLAWAEAYADGVRTVEDNNGVKGFKSRVEEVLTNAGIDLNKYKVVVTESGVDVKLLANMWVKQGFTVVKGDQVLEIGDVINYTATGTDYNGGWQLWGVDEEGNLLIVSTERVGYYECGVNLYDAPTLPQDKWLSKSQKDWLDGPKELDNICEKYGKGEGVVGKARSIRVEDLNNLIDYDPKTYALGEIYQYGNEVTYAWDTTDEDNIKLTYKGTLNSATISLDYDAEDFNTNVFTWYDEKIGTFLTVNKGETTTKLPTIKNTGYSYYIPNMPIAEFVPLKVSRMLSNESYYYFATQYVKACDSIGYAGAEYGLFHQSYGAVGMSLLWNSQGRTDSAAWNVRAVVTLSSDIQLTGSSVSGWSY